MDKVLQVGYHCQSCDWFEPGDFDAQEQDPKACSVCGCDKGQHVEAKVVAA